MPGSDSGHLFRLRECHPGYPDTRIIECIHCGWQSDPALPLEDQTFPLCPSAPAEH
jgi:hypothetical protein